MGNNANDSTKKSTGYKLCTAEKPSVAKDIAEVTNTRVTKVTIVQLMLPRVPE